MCGKSGKMRPSSWSGLDEKIFQRIAKCIDTETDFLRFRAVCRSWRASTEATAFKKFPSTPLKLPFPFDPEGTPESYNSNDDGAYFSLTERTVYHIQLPDSEEPSSWVVKTEKSAGGKLRLLNPLSDHQIKMLPGTPMPNVLDTLGFRVIEVCKAYILHCINPSEPEYNSSRERFGKKVVLSRGEKDAEYAVMAIDENNQLWHIKSGDEKWTEVPKLADRGSRTGPLPSLDQPGDHLFVDVVNYKGQFYALDYTGFTWEFDSMLNRTQISRPPYHTCEERHLVELCDGELFLVELITDEDKYARQSESSPEIVKSATFKFTVEDIIIFWLDRKEKKPLKVKEVKDQIIFAGSDCSFYVSTKEFKGCKGTRVFYTHESIYFLTDTEKKDEEEDLEDTEDGFDENFVDLTDTEKKDEEEDLEDTEEGFDENFEELDDDFVPSDDVQVKFRELHGHNTGVYEYETGKIGSLLKFPQFADVFWPPPSWIINNRASSS